MAVQSRKILDDELRTVSTYTTSMPFVVHVDCSVAGIPPRASQSFPFTYIRGFNSCSKLTSHGVGP